MFTELSHFKTMYEPLLTQRGNNCRFAAAKAGPNKWSDIYIVYILNKGI